MSATIRERSFKQSFIRQAEIEGRQSVLDLGCGTDTLSIWIKQDRPDTEVIGVHGDPAVLSLAARTATKVAVAVQFDEAMSHARPYPDARFDCVISSLFGDSETCNTGEQRHAADGYGCAAAYAERSPSLVKEWLMLKHVKFSELAVEDQDRAIAFYTEKVGFEVAQDSPYKEGWRWVELAIPGADTRVLLTKQPDNYEKGLPRLVLVTDDVEKTYEELTSKGVRFHKAPTQAPWNPGETFAQFEDSEGNGVVLGSE